MSILKRISRANIAWIVLEQNNHFCTLSACILVSSLWPCHVISCYGSLWTIFHVTMLCRLVGGKLLAVNAWKSLQEDLTMSSAKCRPFFQAQCVMLRNGDFLHRNVRQAPLGWSHCHYQFGSKRKTSSAFSVPWGASELKEVLYTPRQK